MARPYEAYRKARRPVQQTIKEAKRRAWDKPMASLVSDLWGRPYKMVLNKLRTWAPPATESMDPRFLEEVAGILFPGAANEEDGRLTDEEPHSPKEEPRDTVGSWSPESRIT